MRARGSVPGRSTLKSEQLPDDGLLPQAKIPVDFVRAMVVNGLAMNAEPIRLNGNRNLRVEKATPSHDGPPSAETMTTPFSYTFAMFSIPSKESLGGVCPP
jgi:hypothetical protein